MSDLPPTQRGGCLCGAVRYRLEAPATRYGACHCGMCRRWTGSVEMGVEVLPGGATFEDETHLAVYRSSDWAERGFCDICGSSLFWRLTVDGPMHGLLSLSVGSLDGMEGLAFDTEVYVDQKPASHAFAGDRKRMTEAEVLASVGLAPPAG